MSMRMMGLLRVRHVVGRLIIVRMQRFAIVVYQPQSLAQGQRDHLARHVKHRRSAPT